MPEGAPTSASGYLPSNEKVCLIVLHALLCLFPRREIFRTAAYLRQRCNQSEKDHVLHVAKDKQQAPELSDTMLDKDMSVDAKSAIEHLVRLIYYQDKQSLGYTSLWLQHHIGLDSYPCRFLFLIYLDQLLNVHMPSVHTVIWFGFRAMVLQGSL